MRNRLIKSRSNRRGSAAIEFAFWLPLVMVMLSGIIDFGWYMARSEIVMRASRDGARQGAAVQNIGDIVTDSNAQANATLTALGYSGCNVSTTSSADSNDLTYLTTVVDCPFTKLLGIAPGLPNTITYRFTMYTELQLD